MCIPSCLGLYLLQFSLAQCCHCFPLSSNVCRNKQLPDLGKSRTSHWPYARLQIYLISRREARSLLCCLKKKMRIKRDNECENVWKLYSVTQIEPLLRENQKNRTPSEQALFPWSAVQVRQVHQSLRWQESFPASLKPKFLVVQLGGGVIYTSQFPRDIGTFGVSQFSGGLLWGCVEKWRGQEALRAAAQPGLPGKDPLAKPTTEVLGSAWLPGAQGNSQSCPWQVPVASCPSVLLQQFLLWALLLLLWLMTDAYLFVISTPLGFCLTAILCVPLFCVTYCIRFWMSPIQAP